MFSCRVKEIVDGQIDEVQYYNASFIDEYSNNFIQLKVGILPEKHFSGYIIYLLIMKL